MANHHNRILVDCCCSLAREREPLKPRRHRGLSLSQAPEHHALYLARLGQIIVDIDTSNPGVDDSIVHWLAKCAVPWSPTSVRVRRSHQPCESSFLKTTRPPPPHLQAMNRSSTLS
jgi:hypothetical protein